MLDRRFRRRFPEAFDFVESLWLAPETRDLSPERTHARLVSRFEGQPEVALPTSRTIRAWRSEREPREDIWSIASAEPGEVALVVPVIDALRAAGRWAVTRKEARVIARIVEAVPGIEPLLALDLAYLYDQEHLSIHLDRFLARLALTKAMTSAKGLQELEDDIAAGRVEAGFLLAPTLGDRLGPAIKRGLERRQEKEDARV